MNSKKSPKARSDLLGPDGTPKYIQCWEYKRNAPIDRYTVVFTNTRSAGMEPQTVYFLVMGKDPHGYGGFEEMPRNRLARSFGTRIEFSSLPEPCRKVIASFYADIWNMR